MKIETLLSILQVLYSESMLGVGYNIIHSTCILIPVCLILCNNCIYIYGIKSCLVCTWCWEINGLIIKIVVKGEDSSVGLLSYMPLMLRTQVWILVGGLTWITPMGVEEFTYCKTHIAPPSLNDWCIKVFKNKNKKISKKCCCHLDS